MRFVFYVSAEDNCIPLIYHLVGVMGCYSNSGVGLLHQWYSLQDLGYLSIYLCFVRCHYELSGGCLFV